MDEEILETGSSIAEVVLSRLDREYHNLQHAHNVRREALDIAREEGATEHELDLLSFASMYHDIGYVFGPAEEHEKRGAEFAEDVLRNILNYHSQEDIERIKTAILATEVPHDEEEDVIAQSIADADLMPLGFEYEEFLQFCQSVRDEWEPDLSMKEWFRKYTLPLLHSESYITKTAQERYVEQKRKNMEKIQDNIAEELREPVILVGGTFGPLHVGHRELLRTAFENGHPRIGLTSNELARRSREREVPDFMKRKNDLQSVCEELSQEYDRDYLINKLTEKKGIAVEADASMIAVSPEQKTIDRVEQINNNREATGKNRLEIKIADEVLAEDGSRISSTRIMNGEIDENGNVLE